MADVSKAQKLASARKKFKELKKERRKTTSPKINENAESQPTSREQTPVENITNTTQERNEVGQLPNYFNNGSYNSGFQQPAAFFDSFLQNDGHVNTQTTFINSYFENEDVGNIAVNTGEEPVNDNNLNVLTETSNDQTIQNQPLNFESLQVETVNDIEKEDTGKTSEEITNFQSFDTVKLDQKLPQPIQLSSVESLRQLSDEMSQLINPNSENPETSFESQLEIRNQELASLLSQEKIKTEELRTVLEEYQKRLYQVETQLKEKELGVNPKIETEMSTLREELQCHVQTVGILVAEKAELVANLNQFQLVAKQKTAECEELQGRLKTSRSRVADLERELVILRNEKSQFDNLGKEQNSELEKLKNDYQNLQLERDELMQDLLEVREKLKTSSETNLTFQQQLAEVSNQLSMANIKIQQLSTGELDQQSSQVEQLTQEKFALEKQVSDLNHTVKTLSKEREESSLQYQQYAQQLNAQLSNMASRLEKLQKENETLSLQEQNRIKHIGELEKQLQNLQNDQMNFALQKSNTDSSSRAELDAALDLIEKLKIENTELQEDSIKILNEKTLLEKELEIKAESIRELEEAIGDLKGNQPDNAKLLAIMESDKVAAARAVEQNTELKRQMDSMQEVFMKLNNDKIVLTEKLTSEQKSSKDLFEKLQKTELHLQTLADAIEIKDKELSNLRENSIELNRQVIHSEQLTDRLRHYEAQEHGTHALQHELQESKQTIARLTEEITDLKKPKREQNEINTNDIVIPENGVENDNVDEIGELKRKLELLELRNKELETKLSNSQTNESVVTDTNHNDQWNVLDKESAMKHLEEKFLKTMEDIANLTEEKQRLEHIVLQLQGETETIGEYVALYQHQRSLLKQKAIEKDQQLTQLANDREHMKNKLEQLNELVTKLVLEKGSVPPELLEHHKNVYKDNHLCEEHAKINNEIHKIAQSSFTIEPKNSDNSQGAETAEQIIALLSEIKSSNLVQPTENFHHCPWCSGQLITV